VDVQSGKEILRRLVNFLFVPNPESLFRRVSTLFSIAAALLGLYFVRFSANAVRRKAASLALAECQCSARGNDN